jgi:hypothetical protein
MADLGRNDFDDQIKLLSTAAPVFSFSRKKDAS